MTMKVIHVQDFHNVVCYHKDKVGVGKKTKNDVNEKKTVRLLKNLPASAICCSNV